MPSILLAFVALVGNNNAFFNISLGTLLDLYLLSLFPISLYGVSLGSLGSLEFLLLCLDSCVLFFVKFVVPHRGFRAMIIILLASPRVSTTAGHLHLWPDVSSPNL
jgi:hypothetical protein